MSSLDRIFLSKVFSDQRKISEELTVHSKLVHALLSERKEYPVMFRKTFICVKDD